MFATLGQAAPGLVLYGGWLAFTAFLVWCMQRAARGKRWQARLGIHAGQLALLLFGLFALFASLLYLDALTCPPDDGPPASRAKCRFSTEYKHSAVRPAAASPIASKAVARLRSFRPSPCYRGSREAVAWVRPVRLDSEAQQRSPGC